MNFILDKSLFLDNPLLHTPFPFLVISQSSTSTIPNRFGFEEMHWHNDLQFIIVLQGKVYIQTSKDRYTVFAGEGVFINKKVLHRISRGKDSEYKSFLFPDTIILSSNDMLYKKFVATYTNNTNLDIFIIQPSTNTHNVLSNISTFVDDKIDDPFYEITIISLIHNLWSSLIKSVKIIPHKDSASDTRRQKRLYLALSYIHTNFKDDITLLDIASSCHISKSELLRLFSSTLQVSPYDYLIDYRIKKGIELLQNTDLLVFEIASLVGYNSQSQFGKHFKERMNLSPAQYRKLNI